MGVLGQNGEGLVRYWPLTNSFFHFGSFYICANFGENRWKMRPWECSQTDKHTDRLTDWQTDRLTDANRFYNLSHAICCSCKTGKSAEENSQSSEDAKMQILQIATSPWDERWRMNWHENNVNSKFSSTRCQKQNSNYFGVEMLM